MIDYLVKIGDIALDDNAYILPGSYRCFPVAKGESWGDAAGGNHDEAYARRPFSVREMDSYIFL